MNLKDETSWNHYMEINQDPYSKCCVDVARRVMEILDLGEPLDKSWDIVNQADDDINAGGITGFMAGCIAQMVSQCHARGDEFRRKWNTESQIHDEGDQANDSGGILNPVLLTIECKK